MWRKVRIGMLLYLLAMVAFGTWLTRARTTDWTESLWVTVYPINGDGSEVATAYIDTLRGTDFDDIEAFFVDEAEYYDVALEMPVRLALGDEMADHPPDPPVSSQLFDVMAWSLRLRFWTAFADRSSPAPADVEIFLKYYDPDGSAQLPDSLGLQKGMIGIVNAFADADYAGSNNVIIAHELLHTLGATDKYNPQSNDPLYPDGYADPEAEPLYPQRAAEIMGGRIPVSKFESVVPRSLRWVVIGTLTAVEIGFGQP